MALEASSEDTNPRWFLLQHDAAIEDVVHSRDTLTEAPSEVHKEAFPADIPVSNYAIDEPTHDSYPSSQRYRLDYPDFVDPTIALLANTPVSSYNLVEPTQKSYSSSQRYYCDYPDCVDPTTGLRSSMSRKADLKRHKISAHGEPYIDCTYTLCNRRGNNGFSRGDHYREHLRSYHGLNMSKHTAPNQRIRLAAEPNRFSDDSEAREAGEEHKRARNSSNEYSQTKVLHRPHKDSTATSSRDWQQAPTKLGTTTRSFDIAEREETIGLSSAAQIEGLEARLRALQVAQKILEERLADADSARQKAEQKLKQKELEEEVARRKLEREKKEENLRRRKFELEESEKTLRRGQWDEIEASSSPAQRRRPALPATEQNHVQFEPRSYEHSFSESETSSRVKRPRKKKVHPRVRSGCDTCKRIKIKCDETKPICRNCQGGGRECLGYHPPQKNLFEPSLSRNNPTVEDDLQIQMLGNLNLSPTVEFSPKLEISSYPFASWDDNAQSMPEAADTHTTMSSWLQASNFDDVEGLKTSFIDDMKVDPAAQLRPRKSSDIDDLKDLNQTITRNEEALPTDRSPNKDNSEHSGIGEEMMPQSPGIDLKSLKAINFDHQSGVVNTRDLQTAPLPSEKQAGVAKTKEASPTEGGKMSEDTEMFNDQSQTLSDNLDQSGFVTITSLFRVLSSLPSQSVYFYHEPSKQWLDRMKCYLERQSSTKWNWWPLGAPCSPIAFGCSRVAWVCHCGNQHQRDLPTNVSKLLQSELMNRRPQSRMYPSQHLCLHRKVGLHKRFLFQQIIGTALASVILSHLVFPTFLADNMFAPIPAPTSVPAPSSVTTSTSVAAPTSVPALATSFAVDKLESLVRPLNAFNVICVLLAVCAVFVKLGMQGVRSFNTIRSRSRVRHWTNSSTTESAKNTPQRDQPSTREPSLTFGHESISSRIVSKDDQTFVREDEAVLVKNVSEQRESSLTGDLRLVLGAQGRKKLSLGVDQLQINHQTTNDEAVRQILHAYRSLRGFMRYTFSIYNLETCYFTKFVKHRARKINPQRDHEPIPETDPDYEYAAGCMHPPCSDRPPIDPSEFTCLLGVCSRFCFLGLFSWHECNEAPSGSEMVARLPKKKTQWDLTTNDRSFAWGLECQLEISALRVFAWHGFFLVTSFVAWARCLPWLPSYLNSVIVPSVVTVVLVSAFWAGAGILISSRSQLDVYHQRSRSYGMLQAHNSFIHQGDNYTTTNYHGDVEHDLRSIELLGPSVTNDILATPMPLLQMMA